MIRVFGLACLIILSLAHQGEAQVTSRQTGDVTSELTRIEHRLVKAWLDGDRAAVDSILAPDWSVIDLTGRVLTKAQVMQELGSGERRIESGSVDELRVRTFGAFAIVTGRSVLAGSYKGQRASVVQRFTDVFAKRDGRWQVSRLARHSSRAIRKQISGSYIEAIAKSVYGFFGTVFLIVDATVMLYHIGLSPEPVENLITVVAPQRSPTRCIPFRKALRGCIQIAIAKEGEVLCFSLATGRRAR